MLVEKMKVYLNDHAMENINAASVSLVRIETDDGFLELRKSGGKVVVRQVRARGISRMIIEPEAANQVSIS